MLLQYRYRVCRENRRDSAGTVMWARDVCKPVAARAVSVSLGRPSVRPPTISLRSLSRTLAPHQRGRRLTRSVYRARARPTRPVSLARWSRPSVTSARTAIALNRRRRRAPSLRFRSLCARFLRTNRIVRVVVSAPA
ncbi:unnamed protein product [Aphis gossypii]|uniref:Uncharacterized protein n=1 Tax=Aphis gossypii TaxID=80765 RepID=A0A9P0IUM7_APHGO|nr:unnamed protein product [Aphis gossypii]